MTAVTVVIVVVFAIWLILGLIATSDRFRRGRRR
jgi:hypothetical protein